MYPKLKCYKSSYTTGALKATQKTPLMSSKLIFKYFMYNHIPLIHLWVDRCVMYSALIFEKTCSITTASDWWLQALTCLKQCHKLMTKRLDVCISISHIYSWMYLCMHIHECTHVWLSCIIILPGNNGCHQTKLLTIGAMTTVKPAVYNLCGQRPHKSLWPIFHVWMILYRKSHAESLCWKWPVQKVTAVREQWSQISHTQSDSPGV